MNELFINSSSRSSRKKWNKSVRLIMFIYSFSNNWYVCVCWFFFLSVSSFCFRRSHCHSLSFLGGVYLLFHLSLLSSVIFTSGYVCELNSISFLSHSSLLLLPLWLLFVSFAFFLSENRGTRSPMCKRKQRPIDFLFSVHWRCRSILSLVKETTTLMKATSLSTSCCHAKITLCDGKALLLMAFFLRSFSSPSVHFCLSDGLVDIDCLINEEQSGSWENTRVQWSWQRTTMYSLLRTRTVSSMRTFWMSGTPGASYHQMIAFISLAFSKRLFSWQTKGNEESSSLSLLGRYLQWYDPLWICIYKSPRTITLNFWSFETSWLNFELYSECGVSSLLLLFCLSRYCPMCRLRRLIRNINCGVWILPMRSKRWKCSNLVVLHISMISISGRKNFESTFPYVLRSNSESKWQWLFRSTCEYRPMPSIALPSTSRRAITGYGTTSWWKILVLSLPAKKSCIKFDHLLSMQMTSPMTNITTSMRFMLGSIKWCRRIRHWRRPFQLDNPTKNVIWKVWRSHRVKWQRNWMARRLTRRKRSGGTEVMERMSSP